MSGHKAEIIANLLFFFRNLLVIALDISQHSTSCWGGVVSGNGLFRSNVLDVQLLNLRIPEYGILFQLLNFVFQLKDSVFHSWSVSVLPSVTCTSESAAVMSSKDSNCSRIFSLLIRRSFRSGSSCRWSSLLLLSLKRVGIDVVYVGRVV